MKTTLLLGIAGLLLLGGGCRPAPATTEPATFPSTSAAPAQTVITTYLTSSSDSLKFCNGADMDSDGYRKTLTVPVTTTTPPSGSTQVDMIKHIIRLAAPRCSFVLEDLDIRVENGVVHIPPFGVWAGVSITMCSCKPEIEVNVVRLPGITGVVWENQ